jgi:hypothetical protein
MPAYWNSQLFLAFHLLFVAVLILIAFSAGCAIIAVYLRLQRESYHWQWISFIAPSTASLFVLVHCAYSYATSISIPDSFTTLWYSSLSLILAIIVGLVCGTSGHVGATAFVHVIFASVKID